MIDIAEDLPALGPPVRRIVKQGEVGDVGVVSAWSELRELTDEELISS